MRFDDASFNEMETRFIAAGRQGLDAFLSSLEGAFEDPAQRSLAVAAAEIFEPLASKRVPEMLSAFLSAAKLRLPLPEKLLVYGLYAATASGRQQELAWPFFDFASNAVVEGRRALAMEMVKKIYNDALSGFNAEMLSEPRCLLKVAELLERVAEPLLAREPAAPQGPPKSKPRLALVTINMLDGVSAYSKTATQFARYASAAGFEAYEYFTEETSTERRQHSLLKSSQYPSSMTGPKSLAEMRALGAFVKFVPSRLDMFDGSLWLAEEMERDSIDAAIFQGGVASPMMWVSSRVAKIPVKTALCVGVNMYQEGQDATVYMSNAANLEREKAFWRPGWGRQVFLPGGVDLQEASAAPALRRSDFQIPDSAVTFGLLSNYVAFRASDAYLSCVARVLKACPNSLFVCMGPGEPLPQIAFMEREGLLDRCRWLSWQHKSSFSSLKLLDFYLNEFPVGGAQVVMEAIACGVPTLAMAWSERHAECVGADIVGQVYAVRGRDLDAYAARAIELASDASKRAAAAAELSARARSLYSAEGFMKGLLSLSMELKAAKGF